MTFSIAAKTKEILRGGDGDGDRLSGGFGNDALDGGDGPMISIAAPAARDDAGPGDGQPESDTDLTAPQSGCETSIGIP